MHEGFGARSVSRVMHLLLPVALLLGPAPTQEGLPPAIAEAIQRLRSDDFEVRNDAGRALSELGETARTALEGLQKDPDADVRTRALDLLRDLNRRARVKAIQEPARRVTIELRDAPLEEGLRRVFEPFGFKAVLRETPLPRVQTMSVALHEASLWEALDAVAARTGFYGTSVPIARPGDHAGELQFSGPFGAHPKGEADAFVGDFRVVAVSVEVRKGQEPWRVGTDLYLQCASWAAPKEARIGEVRLAGRKALSRDDTTGWDWEPRDYPRTNDCIKLLHRWRSDSGLLRSELEEAGVLKVEGMLILTVPKDGRDEEVRVPFVISDLPLPRPRAR